MAASTTRSDRVPGAHEAMFTLFDLRKWSKLPHESVLLKDPDARRIMEEMFLPTVFKRSQLQYQFVRWRALGTSAAMAASSMSAQQIRVLVDQRIDRVGGSSALINRALDFVTSSPSLVLLRPSFMPKVIAALR
jgi:hypothetical protein